jgi:hypothetical protein
MTDRAQPGAIDSIIRNDELAQVFNQFSAGWIQDGASPTPAAVRRQNVDDTALNSFALIGTNGFDVTVDAGEGFVGGWCVRDRQTTITVPQNTTATVVLAWDLDSQFDPNVDPNRDAADDVRVDLQRRVDPQYPATELFEVTTDGNQITTTTDQRRIEPTISASSVDVDNDVSTTSLNASGSVSASSVDVTNNVSAGSVGVNNNLSATSVNASGTVSAGSVDVTTGDVTIQNGGLKSQDSAIITDGEAVNTIHYGRNQNRSNAGDNGVAVGVSARARGNQVTSIGAFSAENNTSKNVTATGFNSASANAGNGVTANGVSAAESNTKNGLTATGANAGQNNTGLQSTAVGESAGRRNSGDFFAGLGRKCGIDNDGDRTVGVGARSVEANVGSRISCVGTLSGQANTGQKISTLGDTSAQDNSGSRLVAVGNQSAENNSGNGVIALGFKSATTNTQDDVLIVTNQNGAPRMKMDLTNGDLSIEGSLNQNANL